MLGYILRDRRPSTAACPACTMGTEVEIVYGEEINYFVLGRLDQPRQNKNLFYSQHDKHNERIKEGPLSFVLFESPIHFSFNCQQGPPHSLVWKSNCLCLTV